MLVSLLLMGMVDLSQYPRTPLGRYVARFMNRRVEALRLSGQALMWVGAAARVPWLVPLGFSVIMFAWLNGLWSPTDPARDR